MSTESSLRYIKELLRELRSGPDPERHEKLCDELDFEYSQALMPWVDVDKTIAKLEDHYKGRIAKLRAKNLELRGKLGGKPESQGRAC